jgi:hypothetical protein
MSALLVGYARCSTDQQDLTAQHDAVARRGIWEIFERMPEQQAHTNAVALREDRMGAIRRFHVCHKRPRNIRRPLGALLSSWAALGPQTNEKRPLTLEDVERCLRRSGAVFRRLAGGHHPRVTRCRSSD